MMSKTHLAVGMATALAVVTIETPCDCALAVAGGALGGVLADVDTLNDDYKHDALNGELIAFGCVAVAAVLDYFLKWGTIAEVLSHKTYSIGGAALFALLWIIGYKQEHRAFTHSIMAAFLFSACVGSACYELGMACLIGYFSHLLIDLLNKKEILLFFPSKRGLCLGWCYASKTANSVLMVVGFIATIALLVYRVLVFSSAI